VLLLQNLTVPDDSIAGFWMLDVAAQLPKSVGLHGIDRSSRYFPKQHPPNVSFSTCSATALPFSWAGYFDFAHQRFLSLSMTNPEWKAALAELYRVTKPGGWVQVGEVYPGFPEGKHGVKQKAVFYAISKARGLDLDIPLQLERHLSAAGFVDVKVEESYGHCGASHGSQGQTYKGRMLALTKAMRSEVLKAGGFGIVESKQEYEEMMKGLEKEYDEFDCTICLFTCTAKKPHPT
jgi:SAM-dependent methyltransferase